MNRRLSRLLSRKPRPPIAAAHKRVAAIGVASCRKPAAATIRSRECGVAQRRRLHVSRIRRCTVAFASAATLGGAASDSCAQVTASGSHPPSIVETQNGLQQLNITAPSSAGVSLNTYDAFDVPNRGVILNNSPTVVSTQQAGYIDGNPNLTEGRSATIIVNEVHGGLPSMLNGYVEVAGAHADVVMANEAGIVVDGGGFINTSRAVLTTGIPIVDTVTGHLGYRVTDGTIAIQGAGLNASNVERLDLIAHAIRANGALYADSLQAVAGLHRVSDDTMTSAGSPLIPDSAVTSLPEIAIDVGRLGGIYANRIVMIGDARGIGVANAGTVVGQTVALHANTLVNRGSAATIAAARDLELFVPGELSNLGGAHLFSLGGLDIAASPARDPQSRLIDKSGAVINDQSSIEAYGDMEIATHSLRNERPISAAETRTTDVSTVNQTKRPKYMACATTNANNHSSCKQAVWDYGYRHPVQTTFSASQIVSRASGPQPHDNMLVVDLGRRRQTIWYESIAIDGNGAVTARYWDDYNPNIHYRPDTEYPSRSDAHRGYQRVEIARATTTTTSEDIFATGDKLASPAQIAAGNDLTLAHVDHLRNAHSMIDAGGSIRIGQQTLPGIISSGDFGGTVVENIGTTRYRHRTQHVVSTYAWNENIARDMGPIVQPMRILQPIALESTGGTINAHHAIAFDGARLVNSNVSADASSTGQTGHTSETDSIGEPHPAFVPQTAADASGANPITLPGTSTGGGLYRIHPAPDHRYLIATDPALTQYANFMSSDYMLAQLGASPEAIEKRLGDGFYETRSVQDQILHLTGRRYLPGHYQGDEQYRALMNVGVRVAHEWNLETGIALTPPQVDALNDDIVWLVRQIVTTDDGAQQVVLAPVVYLARAHAGRSPLDAAQIHARKIDLRASQNVINSGTIEGDQHTAITATNVINRAGTIASTASDGRTFVSASQDLDNTSGAITGQRVTLIAGNDITTTTLVDTDGTSDFAQESQIRQTLPGRPGTITATGTLSVDAGRDIVLRGAAVNVHEDAHLHAARDITLDTVEVTTDQSMGRDPRHHWEAHDTTQLPSTLVADGSLRVDSGNDLNFVGAEVRSGNDLSLVSGGNFTARASVSRSIYLNSAIDDATRTQTDRNLDEQVMGTRFAAGANALLVAASDRTGQGDILFTGSSFVAGERCAALRQHCAMHWVASGNVLIDAMREHHDRETHIRSKRGSAFHRQSIETTDAVQLNAGLGSVVAGDNIVIKAAKELRITASDLLASGHVIGTGSNVTLSAAQDTYTHDTTLEVKTRGLSLGLSGGTVDAFSNSLDEARQASRSARRDDDASAVLHAISAAGSGVGAANGFPSSGSALPGIGVAIRFGLETHRDVISDRQVREHAARIIAGGAAMFSATGDDAGQNGRLTIAGSDIRAQDVVLNAHDQIDLHGTTESGTTARTQRASGGTIGVSYGIDGLGVALTGHHSDAERHVEARTQRPSRIMARDQVVIDSAGDTHITGSTMAGQRVLAHVGGNLTLESVPDTLSDTASQRHLGGGIAISQGSASGNLTVSGGHAASTRLAVTESASILAGAGGFDIRVAGQTRLTGALIASEAPPSLNLLTTGTLVWNDIENVLQSTATSGGLAVGATSGIRAGYAQAGHANAARSEVGSVGGTGGLKPMLVQHDALHDRSTTHSAIGAGVIQITDTEGQHQALESLRRDTSAPNRTFAEAPDPNALLAQQVDRMDAASGASEVAARAIDAYANTRRQGAIDAALNAQAAGDLASMNARLIEAGRWDEGGASRVALHTVSSAILAGLGGDDVFSSAMGAGSSAAAAGELNGVANAIADATGNNNAGQLAGNIASNLVANGLGALVGGNSGAFAAAHVDLFNRSTGNGQGQGGTGRGLLRKLTQAIVAVAHDPLGTMSDTLLSLLPDPPQDALGRGQEDPSDFENLTDDDGPPSGPKPVGMVQITPLPIPIPLGPVPIGQFMPVTIPVPKPMRLGPPRSD